MPRIARMKMKGEPAVYHVMSRSTLDGFALGDAEKEFLVHHIRWLSRVYFAEVLGFCVMGNHFHLLVRMHPGADVNDDEIQRRFKIYYGKVEQQQAYDVEMTDDLRKKWEDLSEYVKEIKQGFTRFYNKRRGRKGTFWSDRFKSVIVENGDTLINCLAYIDLNPVRAGIVKTPEAYRWSSLGYHVQAGNRGGFLSMDFGLKAFGVKGAQERLSRYRRYVYEKGGLMEKGTEEVKGIDLGAVERFRFRTRYFTDSGIIGTKDFVHQVYQRFKGYFTAKHEKRPREIKGLDGIFSLKRLSEAI